MKQLVFVTLAIVALGLAAPVMAEEEPAERPRVLMKTSLGDIVIELNPEQAPISVQNFLSYVDDGFYDGTIFHRVMSGFMIQGGGFMENLEKKPTKEPIKNEATNGLKNTAGTIAMARTPIIDSATAQFFINTADNGRLDHRSPNQSGYGYAVFGRVVGGLNVVKNIESVQTDSRGRMRNVPNETVTILSVARHSE